MYELHENEQYFFTRSTTEILADFLEGFESPCCVCAPSVGRELAARGKTVRTLDIDERFADVVGFERWDLYRPRWLGESFDVIVCDPPFFNVSLSQLFAALRTLARNDFAQPLLVSYLTRRQESVLGTFAPFALRPTGYRPEYHTVQRNERNEIEFYSNLPAAVLARLTSRHGGSGSPGPGDKGSKPEGEA